MAKSLLTAGDFAVLSSETVGDHLYQAYSLSVSPDLLARLATEYVQLRTAPRFPLTPVVVDGIEVIDQQGLEALLARATTPLRRAGPFDIARADIGELLSYIMLRELFGTRFGWLPLRDREVPSQPARGMDLIGIDPREGGRITLVMHQSKVSAEAASPPRVVDSASDCLRVQHLAYIDDVDLAARIIFDAARRADDEEVRTELMLAGLYVQSERLDRCRLVVSSSLLRPTRLYQSTDYGSFHAAPESYRPSQIRFVVLCVDGELGEVVDAWFAEVTRRGREAT